MKRLQKMAVNQTRAGVTLVEVLMSLMIMSIGVAGVATLFPVAALKSAQATKLTNGALLKRNAESIVFTQPELIFDPDGDFSRTLSANNQREAVGEHFFNFGNRNYIVDPNGYMAHAEAGLSTTDPVINDGAGGFCNWFGNNGATAPYRGGGGLRGLRRYDGGMQARTVGLNGASAEQIRAMRLLAVKNTGLGDGWETILDEPVASTALDTSGPGGTAIGVTFDNQIDLSAITSSTDFAPRDGGLLIQDPELYRITVFNLFGTQSQVYPITRISGQTCFWNEAGEDLNFDGRINSLRPLPSEFSGGISRVLVQVKRTNDFNWFLTVRRGGDGAARGIDVCVTFNNGIEPDDEWVYPVVTDNDNDGTAEGGFVAGAFSAEIVFPNGAPEPSVKRGGFVLDVHNARWYRVVSYKELAGVDTSNAASTTLNTVQLNFETAIANASPAGSGMIFFPTLVDVYPMGGLPFPSEFESVTFR